MTRRKPISVVLVLLISACTLGPDYQRPEISLPDTFSGYEVSPGEAAEITQLAWWKLFGDPVLDEMIHTALEQNRDVLIAAARVEEARARFRVTHADRLPQVGASFEALREQDSEALSPGAEPEDTLTLIGTVSWDADLWGRLRRADEAARARLLATVEARRGVLLTLVADVARAYFELRDIDRQLSISLGTVDTRRFSLEIARMRFEGGLTSQLEVRQAETELARAEILVPDLQQQRSEKEHELSVLLGQSPGEHARGNDLEDQVVPPDVPPGLPSELLERRPDIRAAEQAVVAANADVGVAVASLYPSLSLSGFAGSESDELGDILGSGTGIWELFGNLTAPIWQGGRLRGQEAAARARLEQEVLAFDQAILQALREVADALSATTNSKDALESQRRLELASRQYLELADLQYANGVVSYLDVLDAQRSHFGAELELSAAIRRRLLAVVELYRALGGGWAAGEEHADRGLSVQ